MRTGTQRKTRTVQTAAPEATLGDVLTWAESVDEDYDAICELKKVAARLGMQDHDIGLLPANLEYFEKCVASAPYAMVSRARDLETARRRGNSRMRTLLERFLAANGGLAPKTSEAEWTRLIDLVAGLEGFPEKGAPFSTGTSRSLAALRSRCRVAPSALTQAEIDRVWSEATPEKRKSIRRALTLLGRLAGIEAGRPEIVELLPSTDLVVPSAADRAERILWSSLPGALREDCETVFRAALARPEDRAAQLRQGLLAGVSPAELQAEVLALKGKNRRIPRNSSSATAGYRQSVTWLWRAARQRLVAGEVVPDRLELLMTGRYLDAACQDQISRSETALTLKDPSKSQTLGSRLKNLRTVARHGMTREDLASLVDLFREAYSDYVVEPGGDLTDDADKICRLVRDNPESALRYVQAPKLLARKALEALEAARAANDENAEDRALRLYATAALYAVQLSRPLRTSNLIRLRWKAVQGASANLFWISDRHHAEIRFPKGEIKNEVAVTAHVVDDDAAILWKWMTELRKRFLEIRKLADSPYVVPGLAAPRHVKDQVDLPDGCVAPATFVEMWAAADEVLGIGLTPHQCRHATATLILAMEPGNFSKAASVLGDTEETVRKHYGRDSGAAASASIRKALLEKHPLMFKILKASRFR